ncbi:MAG: UDP-2,3-diacylglucosamine diphosphatase [Gammaproteobacteria bacterium]|nr:UDP-2,3-diacylglucosamine diphosphatase [Gammaproteobacteria bacterium]
MTDEYLFISDCHLDINRQDVIDSFVNFLTNRAPQARFLYVLGDLFETWIGDDDEADELQVVFDCFARLSQQTEIYFLAGNRDFLLGDQGAARLHATIINEPSLIAPGQQNIGLLHGDTLCTDDGDYQQFRNLVRSDQWQKDFLGKSLADRKQIVAGLREKSKHAMQQKTTDIMDVNQGAVLDCFEELEVTAIIHGHTHRPAVHHYPGGRIRYVLGDWNPKPSYLSWTTDTGFVLTDPRI